VSSRSVVLVPADRATNVELATQVATAFAAPEAADVHILTVTPRGESWHALGGRPSVSEDNRSMRLARAPLPTGEEGTVRHVRLRGKHESIIAGYAQLTGARAIVVAATTGLLLYGGAPRQWPV
jgi:nucleotide-binding universal stress UspA family protein